ncbi:KaiA family protein [Anabaena catenula]|uniref:Circadian clock oscillator protein KaiA n=1 Tax=Anabaena catenula FACHB-362 TaxID=2692877 RepID=A0ABR8J9N9_9NOST|nr:KaiA family protein [Anabaena catenula]MBD2694197.1 KaiA family protein [Anabaena catenula FACHB-362]
MLLPILIWLPDVKKYLYAPVDMINLRGLIGQMWNLIDHIISQMWCFYFPITIPVNIYYLDKITQKKTNQQLNDHEKYNYVLACNKPKNQQSFQHMSQADKQELLEQLKSDYRQILIRYYLTDKTLQSSIDRFINALFYANIPVPKIIEIHMELIDEFSKQLKLEGRSDETLLDYRLTLIDILANLCEAYRSAVSKIN